MASSKDIFESDIHAADIFAAGIWRGLGVMAEVASPYRIAAAHVHVAGGAITYVHQAGGEHAHAHVPGATKAIVTAG